MSRVLLAQIASFFLGCGVLTAQTTEPKFQIADIHTSPHSSSPTFMRSGFYKGGRYEVRQASMVDLISLAYGVDSDRILGGPSWLEMDHFDVIAIAQANTSQDAVKIMLQNLLADRFKLVLHTDKKELSTYAITVGKKLQLKEADGSGETGCKFELQGVPPGGPKPGEAPPATLTLAYTCGNMTMAAFAEALHTLPLIPQMLGNNPILDETGLKGAWNFEFHFAFSTTNPNAASVNVISDVADKQLGLKLEPRKVPTPVIIVDSANEKPTDNLPGVTEKLPVAPTEFEVADIKPSDPNAAPVNRSPFLPGGRLDLRGMTLKNLIQVAWDTSPDKILGGPKYLESDKYDIVAKAPASVTTVGAMNSNNGPPPVDIDALRLMLRALLIDRFKLATHSEDRPADAYTLVAAKPKMKKADPANRTGYKEGPGPDGKDPRKDNPALGRLVTCQNMSMAQLAEALPGIAPGYFQNASTMVIDATGVEGSFDFTLSFSGAGILNKNGGGRGGDAPASSAGGGATGAGVAVDPGGGITLFDAMEKQIGIRMEIQKRPMPVLVIDHIEQKPTDN
jgi:uncharacterized protein (TIGR03435 family)